MVFVQVRSAFAKIIVILAHVCNQDGPCPPPLLQGLYGQYCLLMVHALLLLNVTWLAAIIQNCTSVTDCNISVTY